MVAETDTHGSNVIVVPTETIDTLDQQAAHFGFEDRHAFVGQLVLALEAGDAWHEVMDLINDDDRGER